jgi:hypothetical protein
MPRSGKKELRATQALARKRNRSGGLCTLEHRKRKLAAGDRKPVLRNASARSRSTAP